jgi:molybdopterin/thiamine biosynthesis adenylyltransferase
MPDLSRYHRQMLLPGIGEAGQRRLGASVALVVGAGALGTVVADLLARAGVGTLVIIDRDVVELTNLQRQTLYDESDAAAALPKATAAARKLGAVNSAIRVEPVVADLTPRTAERLTLAHGPHVLLDCTDNFATRYLVNDLSVKHGIPLVYGGAVGTAGMAMKFLPGRTACLRCLFPEPPAPGSVPTCDTAGVLGPLTAMVGACQAADAIKVLVGASDRSAPRLIEFDVWENRRREVDLTHAREPGCPCCGARDFAFLDGRVALDTTVLCGRNSVQVTPPLELVRERLDLSALRARLAPHGRFDVTPFYLRGTVGAPPAPPGNPAPASSPAARAPDDADDHAGALTVTVFPDGRALIHGTTDPALARSVYARLIGA